MGNQGHDRATRSIVRAVRQSQLAWLILLAGMALTILAWYLTSVREEEKARQEFAVHVNDTLDAVQQRLDAYIYTLYGTRGLFAASNAVTREEFRRYTKETGLGRHHPGVHTFAFIRYVQPHEKARFEKRVRDERGANGADYSRFSVSPPGERNDYFPIEYIEPETNYRYLLGVDRGAVTDTRLMLERARDSGLPAASGRLQSEAEKLEAGRFFLIVLPVYRNGANSTSVAERRTALIGFVTARIELETLLKNVVGAGVLEELFFELYDGGGAAGPTPSMTRENLLFAEHGGATLHAAATTAGARFTQHVVRDVAGRNWLFFFGSRAGRVAAGGYLPFVVLLGGMVTSMLLFALVVMLVAQRQRMLDEVVRQKSLFAQVLDALPVNIVLKDKDFRFVLANEEAARTVGLGKEAVIGKTDFELFPHEVATALRAHDEQVRSREQLVMREERLVSNGEEQFMLAGKKVIRLPGSSEPMLLGFSFDITARQRAELALRESDERLRAILDNTTSLIFLKDMAGRYLLVNREYEKRQGFSREQVIGKTDHELYPRQLADSLCANDELARHAANPLEFEERVPGEHGERTYLSVKFVLRNGAGEPYAVAGIATDITERLRLEKEVARARANELSRALTDAVGEGLIGVDLSHKVVFANPKAQEILGIAENAMLDKKLDDVVLVRTAEGVELTDSTCPAWGMIAEGRSFQTDDWSFRRGDGSRVPVSVVMAPIYDQRQNTGSVMSFQDISLRKRAEAALARVVSQQKAFLNNLPEMAWLKDTESRYILVNEPVSKACGRTPEEMMGGMDVDFWPPELAQSYRTDDRLVMASGAHRRVVEPFEGTNGVRRWIETIKSPIWDSAGKIIGTVGTARDVTERKQAEEDLGRHMAELARVNAELDEFTYVASHDLQEPVRKLVAFSDLLRKDIGKDLPPRVAQDLDFISDAALRMQRLVRDLLALSRTGKVSMLHEYVALDDAVDLALEALALRVDESGARIVRDPLPVVWGDLTLLTQLYQNLIGNALKFVDCQSPEIALTAEQIGGESVFGVRDNGIGIDPLYLEQIFQPFKRLHGQGRFAGSGVGLSICRKVVERHRGRIWVESETGQGAWFKFTLGEQSA